MGISLVIAVTDGDWFDMLRQQPDLAEVNFWAPSASNFRALQPGELFLFKLHAPRNVIVGGARKSCRHGVHHGPLLSVDGEDGTHLHAQGASWPP